MEYGKDRGAIKGEHSTNIDKSVGGDLFGNRVENKEREKPVEVTHSTEHCSKTYSDVVCGRGRMTNTLLNTSSMRVGVR
eukprot:1135552-Ditylum_brightwellii.AAC.1